MKEIKAAGAIVYRLSKADGTTLEVLLVHRPRYQDWSFPKGKLDEGESAEVAACREVAEETGCPIVIDSSIGNIKYHTKGVKDLTVQTRKSVQYYIGHQVPDDCQALKLRVPVTPASLKEIDDVQWVETNDALQLLTYRDDRKLLTQFATTFEPNRSVIVEIARIPHRVTDATGKKIDNPKYNKLSRRTTDFLSSMGIEVLVVLSKKPSAYSTFEPYALQTGYAIHQFSATSNQYVELLDTPNLRMAVVK